MDKHFALSSLVELTNKKLGYEPSTPSEFNNLSWEIQKKTGRPISLSSIKRIWGYVSYGSFPSITTLNTLAIYNGFRSWDTFLMSHNGNGCFDDSGFIEESVISAGRLHTGDRLLLNWGKGKICEMECIGPERFQVNRSQNIKLQPGDTFSLSIVCLYHPLFLSDLTHSGMQIPAYIGARKGGITSITLIPSAATDTDQTVPTSASI